MKKFFSVFGVLLLVLSFSVPIIGNGQESQKPDVELWNALKPLETTLSFLNTGAHPDDEHSHLLAYLSRGLGVRSGLVSATRGQGGQNEIGDEVETALGIIRTRELKKAAHLLGVDVHFLNSGVNDSIIDFGFTKGVQESLNKWGKEHAYKRLVKIIRTVRPDIVMADFRNVPSQHGNHRAVTVLTKMAFEGAADPRVFPQQLENGLSTWQIKKLYLPAESKKSATTSIQIGMYDPIYGMTYPQLAEKSRSFHKTQGMGDEIPPAKPETAYLELVKSVNDIPEKEQSIFEGLAYDFSEISSNLDNAGAALREQLVRLQKNLEELIELYPDRDSILMKTQSVIRTVNRLEDRVRSGDLAEQNRKDLLFRLNVKEDQLAEVSMIASGLKVQTTVEDPTLVQNGQTSVKVMVRNEGSHNLKDLNISLDRPFEWKVNKKSSSIKMLKPGEEVEKEFKLTVPDDAQYYKPYASSVINSIVSYNVKHVKVSRSFKPEQTVAVLPEVSMSTDPTALIVNAADVNSNIPIQVLVKNNSSGRLVTKIHLDLPAGWKAQPSVKEVTFERGDESKTIKFTLTPPEEVAKGKFQVQTVAEVNGQDLSTTVQRIHYDHIGTTYYLYPSTINGNAFVLNFPENLKVGYIDSGFDRVAGRLKNIGIDITKLTESDLESGNLSQYDTIITGIRAYLSREDLRNNNDRLLQYVENGGHMVVQYNKPWDNWKPNETSPYKLVIGQPSIDWRVTKENAPVTVLKPKSPLFNWPNQITQNDWENWVQERGLYFPMQWDDHYETFISMTDPGEDPFTGGILMAEYGQGTYLYTNLVWYRQIQNGVSGGYRIFTNLISYPLYNEGNETDGGQ